MNNLLKAEKLEATENLIYTKLAKMTKDETNKKTLEGIAKDEIGHYNTFKKYTKVDVGPDKFKVLKYTTLARLFGVTFAIKLMEHDEKKVQVDFSKTVKDISDYKGIMGEEKAHETKLIGMINEERLNYVSSIVLGLNDALVELTSALAGLTLAIQDNKLIATTGLITGVAAAMSMAASGYLSAKEEKSVNKNPKKSLVYTGGAYILTVLALITPYLLFNNVFISLGITLTIAVTIIALFTYYISIANEVNFKKKFIEMAGISLGIAAATFGIGYLVRIFLNISV